MSEAVVITAGDFLQPELCLGVILLSRRCLPIPLPSLCTAVTRTLNDCYQIQLGTLVVFFYSVPAHAGRPLDSPALVIWELLRVGIEGPSRDKTHI